MLIVAIVRSDSTLYIMGDTADSGAIILIRYDTPSYLWMQSAQGAMARLHSRMI